jgi:early secretory antigenic target protein ESAT-6
MFGHHRFSVATDSLDSTGGRLRTGAQSIRAELDALVAEVTGLTSSEWTGVASGAFADQYAQLNEGWKQIETALDGIATKLGGTATEYSDTEDRIARGYRAV